MVAASPDEVWEALIGTAGAGRVGTPVARALGCEQTAREGRPGRIGSTVPGFVVTRAVRPAVLALMGPTASRATRSSSRSPTPLEPVILTAVTRAEFPGRLGSAYRLAVVGSRGHVLAVQGILHTVRRRAERAASESGSLTNAGLEHREYAAVILGRGDEAELAEDAVTCFSTARSVTTAPRRSPWLERPSAISASTSRSRGVRRSSGSCAPPAEQPATTSGSSADRPRRRGGPRRGSASTSATRSLSRYPSPAAGR